MIVPLKKLLLILLSFLSFFSSPLPGNFSAEFAPVDEENVRLCFAAVSDIHMTDSVFRSGMLELGLYDMEKAAYPLDALVMTGDYTDHGESSSMRRFAAP